MGIGRATARILGAAGAKVIVLDRHPARGERVAEEIRIAGGRAVVVCADLAGRDAVGPALSRAEDEADGLDILVNITGSATWRPLLELDSTTWNRDFSVNLESQLEVSRQMVSLFRAAERPGVICVVASISGVFAAPGHAAYGAAKAGLISVVRTAAEEWWPLGVRINAVVPGSVRTPRIEETLMSEDRDAQSEEMLARMSTPEEVAGPVAYLVSDAAKKVTGQTLIVDGGTSARFPYSLI